MWKKQYIYTHTLKGLNRLFFFKKRKVFASSQYRCIKGQTLEIHGFESELEVLLDPSLSGLTLLLLPLLCRYPNLITQSSSRCFIKCARKVPTVLHQEHPTTLLEQRNQWQEEDEEEKEEEDGQELQNKVFLSHAPQGFRPSFWFLSVPQRFPQLHPLLLRTIPIETLETIVPSYVTDQEGGFWHWFS